MRKLKAFFGNPVVISAIGILALSIIVWFLGPQIKFGEDNAAPLAGSTARLVVIMVLLALWGLNNLRLQWRDKQQNQNLVEDLQENQQQAVAAPAGGEQAAEELHQINERFSQALSTLKKLKFKSGARGRKALYELPWYIIIGPPGSGKTTALVNSGLDFPLADAFGKGAVKGVGGTRNCDWWFTNEAVMIDTAGRYTTQDSHRVVDSSAWEGFLNLLKKNRRRRPINGAIIAISLSDLLIQTREERQQHAKVIRSRIDELMEKLQIRFPIYLTFTKSDLVSGFAEFFEDLPREDREQVWGVSLPNAPRDFDTPDFSFLHQELHVLLERLYDRVLWRMHQERDPRRRGLIEGFPQQMENLSTIVSEFVEQTFAKNRYQYQPYLRGVYFTSATQDGSPIDRLMTSVSANFGFDRDAGSGAQQQGKSYFLRRLFSEVVFPEAELVGSNRRYETFLRWSRRAGYITAVLVSVAMLSVWAGSFTRNEMYMAEIRDYIDAYHRASGRLQGWNRDPRAALEVLTPLARASTVYDREEHPWLHSLGMYDPDVDRAAKQAYREQLRRVLLPRLLHELEAVLQQGHRGGDLYGSFRTYMMFDQPEHRDNAVIEDWFTRHWARQLHGEATQRQALQTHLQALLELELPTGEIDQRLVRQTRTTLLRVPVAQRIYSRIRSNPRYARPVDLTELMGESVHQGFALSSEARRALTIPVLFTRDAYRELDFSAQSPVIAEVVNERWLFADDEDSAAKIDFVPEDLDTISEQVEAHYLAEYAAVWQKAAKALNAQTFTDMQQAQDVLAQYTDPVYSPLIAVLQLIKEHTQLTLPAANVAKAAEAAEATGRRDARLMGRAGGLLASQVDPTVVDKRFRDLHLLLRESQRRPAPVQQVLQQIRQVQDFIYDISVAPDPGKKAFQVAKARYQSGSGNAITQLSAFANQQPERVAHWLNTLADQSWKVVLGSARGHVASQWRQQIYQPYRAGLRGRYPLNRSADDTMAAHDFSEFFKPGGRLDQFYQGYIQPFIERSGRWGNRAVDGRSLGFSDALLAQLRRAQSIKQVYFKADAQRMGMRFDLKPMQLDKAATRFRLELGEQRLAYSHGPKFWTQFAWFAGDDRSRVRLVFEDLGGERHARAYEGNWAWMRLLDQAGLAPVDNATNIYTATFYVDDGDDDDEALAVRFHIRAESVTNPFNKNLLGRFSLPESI